MKPGVVSGEGIPHLFDCCLISAGPPNLDQALTGRPLKLLPQLAKFIGRGQVEHVIALGTKQVFQFQPSQKTLLIRVTQDACEGFFLPDAMFL